MGRSSRGFTLIELLVVISIIALLIALLLPALSKARETALKLTCLANMEQTHVATYAYATDNDGWYPPGTYDIQYRDVKLGMGPGMLGPGGLTADVQYHDNTWNGNQIWGPNLAYYMGGSPDEEGTHYRTMGCAAIDQNTSGRKAAMSRYSFWYGIRQEQGGKKNKDKYFARIENVRDEHTNIEGESTVGYMFICGDLRSEVPTAWGSIYWGFDNRHGNFGQVHGEGRFWRSGNAYPGGQFVNVMKVDGGTTTIYAQPYPAVAP